MVECFQVKGHGHITQVMVSLRSMLSVGSVGPRFLLFLGYDVSYFASTPTPCRSVLNWYMPKNSSHLIVGWSL